MREIEDLYQITLRKLQLEERPKLELDADELRFLSGLRASELQRKELLKILCILQHTLREYLQFQNLLLHILHHSEESEILVHALYASHRHIIGANQRAGHRAPFEMLKALQKLLNSSHRDVLEWSLRTIAIMGGQGIYFREEIEKIPNYPLRRKISKDYQRIHLLKKELLYNFSPRPPS